MRIIDDIKQGTSEWFDQRLSSIGGHGINIVASSGSVYKKYLYKKAAEYLSKTHEETFKSNYLDRGHEFEPKARELYEFTYRVKAVTVGIVKLTDHKHYSPDFLINDDGFGEIKVHIPSVFIEFADNRNIPTADRRQIQWGFNITGRKYCDYIKYCPEMFESGMMTPMIVTRIYPDEKEIKSLNSAADRFIGEMKLKIKKMKGIE